MATIEERMAALESAQPRLADLQEQLRVATEQLEGARAGIRLLWRWIHEGPLDAPAPTVVAQLVPGLASSDQIRSAWLSKREAILAEKASELEATRVEQAGLIERRTKDMDDLQAEVHRLNGVPTDDELVRVQTREAEVQRLTAP